MASLRSIVLEITQGWWDVQWEWCVTAHSTSALLLNSLQLQGVHCRMQLQDQVQIM